MFKRKSHHSYVDMFEGILIGGSLVAMTTFLYGTKKGKKLQKELKHQYEKMVHKAKELRKEVEKKVKKSTPKIKRTAKMIKTEAERTYKKVKAKVAKARR